MDYYSKIGHYLFYPLAVLAMTSFFFYLGLWAGKKLERARIGRFDQEMKENK